MLEDLGEIFQLDARTMQALVHEQPLLLQLDVASLERQIAAMVAVFGTTQEQVCGIGNPSFISSSVRAVRIHMIVSRGRLRER